MGSVDYSYNLGAIAFGAGQAAKVSVHEEEFTDAVYSRRSLTYLGPDDPEHVGYSKEVNEIGAEIRIVDWVRSATQYTTFEDFPEGTGFRIAMYSLDAVTDTNEITGEPFQTVDVFNPDPQGYGGVDRLQLIEQGDRQIAREYRFMSQGRDGVWELYQGDQKTFLTKPLKYEKLEETYLPQFITGVGGMRKSERRQKGGWNTLTGTLVIETDTEEIHQQYPWGWKKVEEIKDPDGLALTTRWGYREDLYTVPADERPAGHRSVQWIEHPDGNWEWYAYAEYERWNVKVRPVGNEARPPAFPSNLDQYRVTERFYDGADYRVKIVETDQGTVTHTTYKQFQDHPMEPVAGDWEHLTIVDHGDHPIDHPHNEVTRKVREGLKNRVTRVEYPDGRVTLNRYEDIDQHNLRTITTHLLPDGTADRRQVKITHSSGMVKEDVTTDLASGINTQHQRVEERDARFRPVAIVDEVTGTLTTRDYGCCGLASEANDKGQATIYERDVFGRVIAERRGLKEPLSPGNALIVQHSHQVYHMDSQDRQIQTETHAIDGGPAIIGGSNYNLAGQRTSQTSQGVTTEYKTILLEGGGRLELTSLPRSGQDERHRISSREYTADGTLVRSRTYASADPFATVPDPRTTISHVLYGQGADDKGEYRQVTNIANIFDRRVTRTYLNHHGQQTETIHAYGTSLAASERFDYNDDGQLIRQIDPDGVTTRYAYNEKGERHLTAIDLNIEPDEAPDHIEYEVDRITRTTRTIHVVDGSAVQRTTTQVDTESGPHITSISEQSLDGTYSAITQNGQTATTKRVEGDLPGSWQIITTQPNQAYTVQSYKEGLPDRTTRFDSEGTAISWSSQELDNYAVSGKPPTAAPAPPRVTMMRTVASGK